MTTCPSCSRSVADNLLSCPSCGAALVDSATPTRMPQSEDNAEQQAALITSISASPSTSEGRFVTGAILAGRYRIVTLLGRGGMGEVFKAEDLKLNQTVALKFLPEKIALDGAALARFHNEVRIARQVTHPSVCRVYDIGEVEGLHFISDRAYGLSYDHDYLQYIEKDEAPDRWRQLESGRGGAVYLWYRESPNHLLLSKVPTGQHNWSADDSDPPLTLPGMRGVKLDTVGRLREFYARLPQVDEAKPGEASAPDWNRLFSLAGIDPSRFTPAEALWNPESAFDARAAWTGTAADMPDIPLRVEAAGYHGRLVFFKLIGPWTKPNQAGQSPPPFFAIVSFGVIFGAVLLAWRNYRQRKGDRQGALRLAVLFFVEQMLFWLLTASHVPTVDETRLLGEGVSSALFLSAIVWALYLALEPYVRRRWPTSLITWSRVLAGKFTDPLVGRDLLIGILFGLCFTLLIKLLYLIFSQPAADVKLEILLGVRFGVGDLLDSTGGAVVIPLAITFLLTLLRALVRRDWLAGAVVVLISVLPGLLSTSLSVAVVGLIFGSLIVLAFIRFGLLALAGSILIFFWLSSLPFTTNLSAWYAGTSLFVMFLVTALAALAFYTSLGGQKVFKGKLLEE